MAWPTYSRTTENPARLGDRLHGVADVGDAVAVDHRLDAGVAGLLGDLDQPLRLGVDRRRPPR